MIELLDSRWGFVYSDISSDGDRTVEYENHIAPDVVPALFALRERMTAAGYELLDNKVRVIQKERTVAGTTSVSYQIFHRVRFRQGDGILIANVKGHGTTLDEVVGTAQVRVIELWYNGAPVASGKGQLNACREIARQLYAKHGAWLPEEGQIVVGYDTRGGRGGWKSKVAHRRFILDDLSGELPTGRYYCTACGRIAPRNRQHWVRDDAARTYIHLSHCCNAPVRRGAKVAVVTQDGNLSGGGNHEGA